MKKWIAIGLRMFAEHIDPQPTGYITLPPLTDEQWAKAYTPMKKTRVGG